MTVNGTYIRRRSPLLVVSTDLNSEPKSRVFSQACVFQVPQLVKGAWQYTEFDQLLTIKSFQQLLFMCLSVLCGLYHPVCNRCDAYTIVGMEKTQRALNLNFGYLKIKWKMAGQRDISKLKLNPVSHTMPQSINYCTFYITTSISQCLLILYFTCRHTC